MFKIPPATLFVLIMTTLCIAPNAQAEKMYRWVDKDGVTHFTREPPNPDMMGKHQGSSVNQNRMAEKQDYLQQRALLDEQISGTINAERREQLKRERLVLDYNWYKHTDPQKAAELEAQLGKPQVRVVPKEEQPSDMDKYKAFF